MLPNVRSVAGKAHQQPHENQRQRDIHFQGLGNNGLGNGPIMSYEGLNEVLYSPAAVHKVDREMVDWDVFFNSPICSSSDSDCSQDTMVPSSVFLNLLDADSTNLESPLPKREQAESHELVEVTVGSAAKFRKRSSKDALATEYVTNDAGQPKRKTRADVDIAGRTRTQFACPFQKLDVFKHHECLKFALHRIKDVKQHVYRRHKQPEYYCARCFDIFNTADARDEHARSKDCENRKDPGFEGITELQRKELNKHQSRGLDTQEQWFRMWDIIFPGRTRPGTVFVGNYLEEVVPLLRSLWARHDSSILAMTQRERATRVDPTELDALAKLIFDILEAEASTSLAQKTLQDSSQDLHSLAEGRSPRFTNPSTVIDKSPSLLYSPSPYFLRDINDESEADFHIGEHVTFAEG